MIDVEEADRKPLNYYLGLEYPFVVVAHPDGDYVISFPDLPGCMTQVESLAEVGPMAEEARNLWIETAYDHGIAIPPPSYPEEYSGKFNLRLPRSLHRSLAESAERNGVSLNQYVVMLLSRGDVQARMEHQMDRLEDKIDAIHERFPYHVTGVPTSS
ncbi:toxin-antitoxin system HicB family antitoxin [Nitrolancea hollandica]|uniref:toxin-antitoxin system HicB family antitoxin n=1 Tax=Nitrolancea hollandica TaxID=1206749 RepID=UPI00058C4A8C|nr:toxin-antitoxin system HicB family antitoxin [Nitrolancea hollandica]